jgi:predicted HicB family RNase H-like nuclease
VRKCDEREAWEDVNYVDLEVDEDFLEKMTAIMLEQEYDTMVSIPLDLGKEELHTLMLMAHEKNITLNEMVAEVLQAAIDHAKEIVGTDNGFQK